MGKVLVVSPHLDDAVLSIGQALADRDHVIVLTIFAGDPPDGTFTPYDEACGFLSSVNAMKARRAEDAAALAALHCTPLHAPFLDGQYTDKTQRTISPIVDFIAHNEVDQVVGPLGICHPDHIDVSMDVLFAAKMTDTPLWLYEELPYRVLDPVAAANRLQEVREAGWHAELGYLGGKALQARKRKAVECYTSQLHTLDETCLWVPERVWKLT